MRLTIRCILAALRAVEQMLEEATNKARGPQLSRYYADLKMTGKLLKETRSSLHDVLDRMTDKGDGE